MIPDGFATTSEAYWKFLKVNGIKDKIQDLLNDLEKRKRPLDVVGKAIRRIILRDHFPEEVAQEIGGILF